MTTYQFNIHIENVHHVEVNSDAPLHEVVRELMDGLADAKLDLSEPNMERVEFWDVTGDECYEVGHVDGWGNEWCIGEEEE